MSLKVIELNDLALQAGDDGGVLATSPGFALLQGKEVILGAEAEQQHRLYPTSSHHRFWQELNMAPLQTRGRIRHHADLAYSQLLALAGEAGIDGEVILAVPGHFSREQLGLLLGITGQCPFQVTGMVDSALAAAVPAAERWQEREHSIVHAALHLHQVLLTLLRRRGGELIVDKIVPVPQLGRQQLLDALMRIANDAFIRQCRFNPQHEAASEQQLWSILADWLGHAAADQQEAQQNLLMELQAGATTYSAKLPHDQLLTALQKPYRSLLGSLAPLLESADTGILLDQRLANLPGAVATLGEAGPLRVARPEAVFETCLRFKDRITAGEHVGLIRALPFAESAAEDLSAASNAVSTPGPTHVLFRNRAFPVDDLPLLSSANGSAGPALALDIPGPATRLGRIALGQSGVSLDCGASGFQLNDAPVSGQRPLQLGDRIRVPRVADEILLIEVSDGRRS